jgi:hypothetical protein
VFIWEQIQDGDAIVECVRHLLDVRRLSSGLEEGAMNNHGQNHRRHKLTTSSSLWRTLSGRRSGCIFQTNWKIHRQL